MTENNAIPGKMGKIYDRFDGHFVRKAVRPMAVARKLLVRCWVMLLRKEPWNQETMIGQPAGIAVAV